MNRRAIVLRFIALAMLCGACKQREATLSLLVWEGYADPSFVHSFEEAHQCKIVASYMGSSDELVAKLRGGSASNYDVISPSSDVATSIVRSGLGRPPRPFQIPFLQSALLQTPQFAARQSKRSSLWRSLHVGPQSTPVRHSCY